MTSDCLKLTTYFGERDRSGNAFLADALLDLYERRELATSVLLRGIEGFGPRQRLQTQRLLTLSEDLPIVSVAVDRRERIERVLPEVVELSGHGVITLERARLLGDGEDRAAFAAATSGGTTVAGPREPLAGGARAGEATPGGAAKLTIYLGRHERAAGMPAHRAVVELLQRSGIAGATVLLGVDGTRRGERRRARLLRGNATVPMMVISVGAADAVSRALHELHALLERPLVTLERVELLKRDGERLRAPRSLPDTDPAGLALWQKLMIYAGEQAQVNGHPLYAELVRRLRAAGARGATALRGVWGYHGAHPPHGDSLLALRRQVPVVTVIVDTPERTQRWFEIVDDLTAETGLVTSEIVPATRVSGSNAPEEGLTLASTAIPAGRQPARRSSPFL